MRARIVWALVAVLAAGTLTLLAPPANATPPNIPSKATAQSQLSALRVAAVGSTSGYSRDKFPSWINISGNCDTRETVLMRDGTGVSVGGDCYPTAGRWPSPYDGTTVTTASSVDIDHVVPLAEAWRSGASSWTTAQRQSFANDLNRPQLIAVSASVNRSKGDQDPAQWLPPVASYRCTYVKMWIAVKSQWKLTVDSAEKSALTSQVNGCSA